ncbi:hypothetical protein RD792_007823 [Penstemon davidsonii]|uniref:Uncharacterized protein n=1 Tax=Penstemon davidsonii TaxID=160366 RepID=A0ABR0D972_9LAMI|nr:hypothetical protein RD792_007823 [Penstemon davidsonii]
MYKCMAGMKKVEEFDISDAAIMNSIMEDTFRELKLSMGSLRIGNPNKDVASISAQNVVIGFRSASSMVVVVGRAYHSSSNHSGGSVVDWW